MNQHEILTKLSDLKGNLQHFFSKKSVRSDIEGDEASDNYLDDLPLTMNRDPSPTVKYYTTENSEFSRGQDKEAPKGIDSFSEKKSLDFDEADDYQTNRDRKQNSDLAKRFYTSGMDLDDFNK